RVRQRVFKITGHVAARQTNPHIAQPDGGIHEPKRRKQRGRKYIAPTRHKRRDEQKRDDQRRPKQRNTRQLREREQTERVQSEQRPCFQTRKLWRASKLERGKLVCPEMREHGEFQINSI